MYESGFTASESALDVLLPKIVPADTLRMVVQDFKRYLVSEHNAVQAQLEGAVIALQTNPCDKDARKKFQFLVQYVNFNGRYLHRIASACKDTSADVKDLLLDYRKERE